jgi:hypothetical protein
MSKYPVLTVGSSFGTGEDLEAGKETPSWLRIRIKLEYFIYNIGGNYVELLDDFQGSCE